MMFYGVDVWLMTSGFFISYLLLKQYKKLKSYKILLMKIIGRFLRLWPIYLVGLCIDWYIIPFFGDGPLLNLYRNYPKNHCSSYVSHLFMVSNLFE